jgi:hypothetical protein
VTCQEQVDRVRVTAADATVAAERRNRQNEPAQPGVATGQCEARKGDLAGAQLERHDRDRQAQRERDQPGEHERHPMSLEHLQQRVGIDHLAGAGALESEQGSEHAGGQQTEQAQPEVDPPDPLVIGGGRPRSEPTEERRHA